MAYLILNGEVVSTFYGGKGARIKESFTKRDGTEGATYYSAFFQEPHGLGEGDTGVFKGNLSVGLNEYEGKTFAQATINNAKAEEIVPASADAGFPAEAGVPSGF